MKDTFEESSIPKTKRDKRFLKNEKKKKKKNMKQSDKDKTETTRNK